MGILLLNYGQRQLLMRSGKCPQSGESTAGRFALSKPAETGTSVTNAAAECSAVVADVKNGAGRAPPVTEESKQGGSETMARKNVTSPKVAKMASKVLSSPKSSKTNKAIAGSALSQTASKRSSKRK